METQEPKYQLDDNKPIIVVMVPFPAQSHLNILLQLSHIISSYNNNIQVHYVASSLHLSQVKSRQANHQNPNHNITFHSFPTPDFPSPPPHNTAFPTHLIPSFHASVGLRGPTASLLASLSEAARRLVVIHDALMSVVVQDASVLPNVETYVFHCASAVYSAAYARDVAGLKMRDEIPHLEGTADDEFMDFVHRQLECLVNKKTTSGILRNTCKVIESEFLDLIAERERVIGDNVKRWAIGPLETVTMFTRPLVSHSRRPPQSPVSHRPPLPSGPNPAQLVRPQIRPLPVALGSVQV